MHWGPTCIVVQVKLCITPAGAVLIDYDKCGPVIPTIYVLWAHLYILGPHVLRVHMCRRPTCKVDQNLLCALKGPHLLFAHMYSRSICMVGPHA